MENNWKGEEVLFKRGNYLFKLAVIFALVLSQFPIFTSAAAFKDVNEKHWAKDVMEEWDDQGFIAGYPDGNFYPNKEVSRAEFVAFIARSIKDHVPESQPTTKKFHDVRPSDWFYDDVMWAVEHGVVSGYADGSFKPTKSITREEAAAILFNIKKYETDKNNLEAFQDYQSISGWSKEAVNQILGQKVMNGFPDGTFQPLKPITWAESVSTLNNMYSLLNETDKETTGSGISGMISFEQTAVSGATIKVYDKDGYEVVKQSTTNEAGSYAFDLPNGNYDITVEKGNLVGFKNDIFIKNSKISEAISLTKGVKVSGKIKFDSKEQAKNAVIIFKAEPTFTKALDDQGHYSLYLLPNSKYSIRLAVNNQTKLLDFDVEIDSSDKVLKEYIYTTETTSTTNSSDDDSSSDNDSSSSDVDTTPPGVSILSPTAEAKYGSFLSTITLSGTAFDNKELASVEYEHYAIEGATQQVTTADTITLKTTTPDTITVDASDDSLTKVAAGNTNGKEQWTI